jgi:hypothetical protein
MIPIDKNSKIELEHDNYILYYRIKDSKAKNEGKKWVIGGYFPNLDTLLQDWVVNAPAHTSESLTSLQQVVDVIQKAEKHMVDLIHNNK